MSVVLALPLPLVGAAGPVQGLLTRDRAYRTLALRTVSARDLGTLAGIVCALRGAGAWALVVQQVVISGSGALALLLRCPMRPCRTVSRQRLREMLRIGLPLTASTLVQHGRYRLFALLIGGTAGAAALGQVHMAFRLVDTVRELAFTAQWRLMLPLLSERQDDLPACRPDGSLPRLVEPAGVSALRRDGGDRPAAGRDVARPGLAARRGRGAAADRADGLAVPGVSRRASPSSRAARPATR